MITILPSVVLPNTSLASRPSTSPESSFARRSGPANEIAATVTITYVSTRMIVAQIAARPGASPGSSVSSFTVTVVSQPQ